MKIWCFTIITCLFCAGLTAQTYDYPSTVVQPEFGFVLDGIISSNPDMGLDAAVKMAELSVSSRIDPYSKGYAIIEFPNLEAPEIAEAAVIFDGFGDGLEIRVGRMLMDFGKWNTLHEHDLAMPFGDPVRAGLFGGALKGTGIELHNWFAVGDAPIRFSLGAWSSVGSHAHGGDEHADQGEEEHGGHVGINSGVDGRKGIQDWSFSGRLSSQRDIGNNGWWQWGLSYFGSAGGLEEDWENELGDAEGEAFGLGARTLGFDLSIYDSSFDSDTWNKATLEYWLHEQDHAHAEGAAETFDIERSSPEGLWLLAEHGFNSEWSLAASVGRWEAENFEALDTSMRYGLAINHHVSELDRIRLAVEQIDMPGFEDEMVITLQWSSFMGKHRHGMDW
jgi:hypothetical protein